MLCSVMLLWSSVMLWSSVLLSVAAWGAWLLSHWGLSHGGLSSWGLPHRVGTAGSTWRGAWGRAELTGGDGAAEGIHCGRPASWRAEMLASWGPKAGG